MIGPSFYDELKVAGLVGVAFTWRADGTLTFRKDVTTAKRAACAAVLAAHDPATKVVDPREALRTAVKDATTVAQLKTAVLKLL